MNLQDMLDEKLGKDVSSSQSERKNTKVERAKNCLTGDIPFSLSVTDVPFNQMFHIPGFSVDLERIAEELSKAYNKTYALYDEYYNFLGISNEEVEGCISIKRNVYSLFLLLIYGFTKMEIMEILHVSRSYVSLMLNSLREYCRDLLDYSQDISEATKSYTVF